MRPVFQKRPLPIKYLDRGLPLGIVGQLAEVMALLTNLFRPASGGVPEEGKLGVRLLRLR